VITGYIRLVRSHHRLLRDRETSPTLALRTTTAAVISTQRQHDEPPQIHQRQPQENPMAMKRGHADVENSARTKERYQNHEGYTAVPKG
jgi:hypothetical protein